MEMSAAADFHFELAIAGRVSGLPVNTSVPWQPYAAITRNMRPEADGGPKV